VLRRGKSKRDANFLKIAALKKILLINQLLKIKKKREKR
tara:strand:+ start:682 stop:798 length:117 start_codon:yes stop_codon:yes gene_type:complete